MAAAAAEAAVMGTGKEPEWTPDEQAAVLANAQVAQLSRIMEAKTLDEAKALVSEVLVELSKGTACRRTSQFILEKKVKVSRGGAARQ